jgi:hypothetical protein
MQGWNFAVIPQTTEKYIATMADFEVGKRQGDGKAVRFTLTFLDSYQFLSAGLASLVEKLPRDRFFISKRQIGDFDWLFRKGIFPYTWLDDWSKLDATALPPIDAFFDTLTNSINN